MIFGRFGRENTVLKEGKYIKDLTYLNRPLKEIVYIDFEEESVQNQPENVILIPQFDGDREDRTLYDLLPFLEHLGKYPGDVRKEIARFGREDGYKRYIDQQQ
jgi:import inner membrane translocase subunit TIM50